MGAPIAKKKTPKAEASGVSNLPSNRLTNSRLYDRRSVPTVERRCLDIHLMRCGASTSARKQKQYKAHCPSMVNTWSIVAIAYADKTYVEFALRL
jgi:hypothetical protein